jgi:hypothetical protein
MAEQDGIRKKAEALFKMTEANGCTQAEAELAAQKLLDLAQKHGIDLASLGKSERAKVLEDGCKQVSVELHGKIMRKCWYSLANNIAEAFDCSFFADKRAGTLDYSGGFPAFIKQPSVVFVGFRDDAEMAGYLFSQLHHALWLTGTRNGAKEYRKRSKAFVYAHYFVVGAGIAIRRRAEEEWRKREAAADAGDAQAIALRSLAMEKRYVIEKYMEGIRLSHSKPKKLRMNRTAMHGIIDGHKHGEAVGLRRALTA